MNYKGDFVMGIFCTDLAKTLIPREKKAPNKEYTPTVPPGGSEVENNWGCLYGKSQDPALGR